MTQEQSEQPTQCPKCQSEQLPNLLTRFEILQGHSLPYDARLKSDWVYCPDCKHSHQFSQWIPQPHTPRPWYVNAKTVILSPWRTIKESLTTKNGRNIDLGEHQQQLVICRCDNRRMTHLENEANAEFIVRACNNYDDLLTACKGALAALTQNKTYEADIETARVYLRATILNQERS